MKKRKILLIDDEEDFCFFVQANLEARGEYRVKTAHSGEDGVHDSLRFKPDLIILDIMMPNVDGFMVLKELKQNAKTLHIPVLMLTAKHDDESKIQATGLYSEGYLTKPVRIDELQQRIQKILNMRSL